VRIDQSDVYYHWQPLFTCLRRLEVPFIGPRGLGAVGSYPVAHRTVQCTTGHPLFTVRCGSPSKIGAVDRCRLGAVGASDTVRCTPDSPVPPSDRWLGHTSRTDCEADRWLTGQSGAPPDSPVNFSRTPPMNSRERPVDRRQPGAPDSPVYPDCAES
jgi:hypothetical protein